MSLLSEMTVPTNGVDPSREEARVNAYAVLHSAAATAYEHADNQSGSSRQVARGALIEPALRWVDSVLDGQPGAITNGQ